MREQLLLLGLAVFGLSGWFGFQQIFGKKQKKSWLLGLGVFFAGWGFWAGVMGEETAGNGILGGVLAGIFMAIVGLAVGGLVDFVRHLLRKQAADTKGTSFGMQHPPPPSSPKSQATGHKPDTKDHYETLGVSPHADAEVIRAAYKAMVRKYDADADPTVAGKAEKIDRAFAILSDPAKRKDYDVQRAQTRSTQVAPAPSQPAMPEDEPATPERSIDRIVRKMPLLLLLALVVAWLIWWVYYTASLTPARSLEANVVVEENYNTAGEDNYGVYCPSDANLVWDRCFGVIGHPDGPRYEGNWVDDKKNGRGVYTWPDGRRYEGNWVDDKMSP